MRVPVGYWIMDAPEGGSSPLEYGISPEGFVTGGLNSLYKMLVALRRRGIAVQLDMHAMVCNSACISDGMYCAEALAFAPPGRAPIGEIARCGGGTYQTTRVPRAGEASWGDVGVNALGAMAEWVAALPDEAAAVAALQLANEPALAADGGLGGPTKSKEDAVNAFYQAAIAAVRPHLPSMPLILSFIPPSAGVMSFLQGPRLAASGPHLVDHHFYLNWLDVDPKTRVVDPTNPDDPKCCMPWAEIHRRACAGSTARGVGWQVYVEARQPLVIGEWSLAVNHDQRLDLTDYQTRYNLRRLYQEQLQTFSATPGFSGAARSHAPPPAPLPLAAPQPRPLLGGSGRLWAALGGSALLPRRAAGPLQPARWALPASAARAKPPPPEPPPKPPSPRPRSRPPPRRRLLLDATHGLGLGPAPHQGPPARAAGRWLERVALAARLPLPGVVAPRDERGGRGDAAQPLVHRVLRPGSAQVEIAPARPLIQGGGRRRHERGARRRTHAGALQCANCTRRAVRTDLIYRS